MKINLLGPPRTVAQTFVAHKDYSYFARLRDKGWSPTIVSVSHPVVPQNHGNNPDNPPILSLPKLTLPQIRAAVRNAAYSLCYGAVVVVAVLGNVCQRFSQ